MTAEQNPLQVLLFAGSLRKNSLNKKLIELVGEAVGNYGAKAQIMDVQAYDCPSFNEDAESTDNIPAGASLLVEHILAADAIIIAAPEYNGSFPGFLKNILDWVSRYRPQPLYQKQMLLISASPSMGGGNRGLWNLRMPFEHMGARVYPEMFSLATAHQELKDLEHFKSDRLYQRLIQLTAGFLDLAEAAKHYPCMKKAWIEFNSEKVQPDIPQIDTAASK